MDSVKKKALIAILAMSSIMMAYLAVSPILAEISRSFPEASTSQVQMVLTIASFVALPVMLLAGKLADYISKKTLVCIGLILVILSAIFPLFFNSKLWMLYVASSLSGAGMAFVNVISSALISDYFKGVDKGRVMGYQSSALSLFGALMTSLSGIIATNWHWHYSYLIGLFAVPMLVVVITCLGKDVPNQQEKAEEAKGKMGSKIIYWACLGFFVSLFMNTFSTNIAMLLDSSGMGDAAVAGSVSSVFMLIGIPAGLVLGKILAVLKKNVVSFSTIIEGLGLVVIALSQNLVMVYIGTILYGIGFAIRNPAAITFTAYMVPSSMVAMAISIINAIGSIGSFVSPFVMNFLGGFFGDSVYAKYMIAGIGIIIVGIIYYIKNPVSNEDIENN